MLIDLKDHRQLTYLNFIFPRPAWTPSRTMEKYDFETVQDRHIGEFFFKIEIPKA